MKSTFLFVLTLLLSTYASPIVTKALQSRSAPHQVESQHAFEHSPAPKLSSQDSSQNSLSALTAASFNNLTYTGKYVTAPANLPVITVTVPASGTAPGDIFFATFFAPAKPAYLMIVDNSGELIYYKPAARPNLVFADFKVQLNGNLTYFEGINNTKFEGSFLEMTPSYELTRTWQTGSPYLADLHDLQILPNGRALIMSYDIQRRDLSTYGGLTNTIFIDTLIQEVDSQQNVFFSWRASDHLPITDTYESLTATFLDHSHGNAVVLDYDGNILLSSRHLSEITKINRQTGDIIWRLGGKENQFNFINDNGFSYQHDIRRLPNGNLTLFDNGNQRIPPYSRAVEYQIDESTKVITRVWEYRHTPDIFGSFMGDVQRLPNGNTFIGWGGPRTLAVEMGPDGTKRLELELEKGFAVDGYSYRWFRFPWVGTPVTTPTLVLTDAVTGSPTLYYSWNGATEIASYRVESGPTDNQLFNTETYTKTGFENATPLDDLPTNTCSYRIMPIDKNGQDTRYSDVISRSDVVCSPEVAIAGLVAANTSPQIEGDEVQFTANITAGNFVSYTWNFGDSSFGTKLTPTHAYTVAGLYTATVTATNGLGSVIATTLVTVTDIPIAGLTALNDTPTVEGNEVQLTANITAGTHVSYTWDFGDNGVGTGVTPTHTYTGAGLYAAIVTATNGLGSVVTTTSVTVTDVPLAGLIAANDSPKAEGDAVQFTATLIAGTHVTYAWDFGDGSLGVGITYTHAYSGAGLYTATVTATNGLGSAVATTPVTVTDVSLAGLTAANDSPKAEGDAVQFTATLIAGTHVSYTWDFGDNGVGTGVTPTHTYTGAGLYTATVTATNALGNVVTTTRVTVTDVPIAELTALNDSPKIGGEVVQFTASITAGTQVSYAWNFGDGASGSGTSPSHIYTTAGLYTATATATNGSGSVIATTLVTVTDVPLAGLAAANDSPKAEGDAVQFTATLIAGTHVTYTWNFGDGPRGSGQTPTHVYATAGFYIATVTATNGLGSIAAATRITVTGAANNGLLATLRAQLDVDVVTYTLILTNISVSEPAFNVVISGSIPTATVLISSNGISTPSGGDYGVGYVALAPMTVSPGARATLVWTVRSSVRVGIITTRGHVNSSSFTDALETSVERMYRYTLPVIYQRSR